MSISSVPSIDYISPVIKSRMPQFVLRDYPHFASYMEKYFSHLEQDDNFLGILTKWRYNNDASNEVEPYIDAILNDLGWTWKGDTTVPKKVILAFLRDFYLSRGTERSFRFLFSTLFGQKVRIRYPRDRMLVTSAAEYLSSYHVYATATSKNTLAYNAIVKAVNAGESVFIEGVVSGAVAGIERIQAVLAGARDYLAIQIMETLDSFVDKEDIKIVYQEHTVVEKLHNILALKVKEAGTLNTNGDSVLVEGPEIQGNITIKGISAGGVDSLDIINGGTGYAVGEKILARYHDSTGFGFFAEIKEVGPDGEITKIHVLHKGHGYKIMPKFYVETSKGQDAVLKGNTTTIGSILNLHTVEPYVDFDPATVKASYGNAVFEIDSVPVFEKRFYRGRQGVLGENSTLTDSYRYQQFSYDIVSPVQADRYDPIVKDLLHPAGYVSANVFEIQQAATEDIETLSNDSSESIKSEVFIFTLGGEAIITLNDEHLIAKA